MSIYTKRVKALDRETAECVVMRDGVQVMFQWFYWPFHSLDKKLERASSWGDEMICVLERREVL